MYLAARQLAPKLLPLTVWSVQTSKLHKVLCPMETVPRPLLSLHHFMAPFAAARPSIWHSDRAKGSPQTQRTDHDCYSDACRSASALIILVADLSLADSAQEHGAVKLSLYPQSLQLHCPKPDRLENNLPSVGVQSAS